ncbi:hypothetical protein J0H58_20325 [bacterium]|nr:hypothetical protein [bacterium]
MSFNPRGAIVRTIRVSETETTADGAEVTRTVSGAGVVIHVRPHVPNMKPADVRRAFLRAVRNAGCVAAAVEHGHGHYRQAGNLIGEAAPSAFQVVGPVDGLRELVTHFAVGDWHFAVGVRVPTGAQGAGPEKVRPAMRNAFGKPEQVAATAAALAKGRSDRMRAAVNAGEL